MCLPFCSLLRQHDLCPFILPFQGRLNVLSSSNDVYWLINPQPNFYFYLSLCPGAIQDPAEARQHNISALLKQMSQFSGLFQQLHLLPSMILCTIAWSDALEGNMQSLQWDLP